MQSVYHDGLLLKCDETTGSCFLNCCTGANCPETVAAYRANGSPCEHAHHHRKFFLVGNVRWCGRGRQKQSLCILSVVVCLGPVL